MKKRYMLRNIFKTKYNFHNIVLIVFIGLLAGFLSGLFGVGGGMVIVPALTVFMKFDQRHATATSLVAIIITSLCGSIVYGLDGKVSFLSAFFLIIGSVFGSQIGVYFSHILPKKIFPWCFTLFVLLVICSSQVWIPLRNVDFNVGFLEAICLIFIGVFSGIFSGILGVGGGGIIVPCVQLLLGMGDLMARGTALLVTLPTAISGSIANARYHYTHFTEGIIIGIFATFTVKLGAIIASSISPFICNILFCIFLFSACLRMILKTGILAKNKR